MHPLHMIEDSNKSRDESFGLGRESERHHSEISSGSSARGCDSWWGGNGFSGVGRAESGYKILESQKGVTEKFSSESLQHPEEMTSVPDDRETPSSELLDESQSFAKEEQT